MRHGVRCHAATLLNTEGENMTKYNEFEFRTQPWFDQSWFDRSNFQGFSKFIPMKTIVIHCFDPRASEIPPGSGRLFRR